MTVVFGIVCFFFMPDTPALARFLTDEERDWALQRMRIDASGATDTDVDQEEFDWHWVKMAIKAPQMYLCAAIWFFLLVPLYVGLVLALVAVDENAQADEMIRATPCSSPPLLLGWATSQPSPNCSRFHQTWLASCRSL